MKIEKLYTSKGFGKYLESLTDKEFCKLNDYDIYYFNSLKIDGLRYKKRVIYDELIEQSLTKEMFVNEIEKPNEESYKDYNHDNIFFDGEEYEQDFKEWKEAEKKVIFDDIEYQQDQFNYFIEFTPHYFIITQDFKHWYFGDDESITCLSDLAEKTNGQLKLKNVEF